MKLEEMIERKKNGEYILRTASGVMKLGRRPERYMHTSKSFDNKLKNLDVKMKKREYSHSSHDGYKTKYAMTHARNTNFIQYF